MMILRSVLTHLTLVLLIVIVQRLTLLALNTQVNPLLDLFVLGKQCTFVIM